MINDTSRDLYATYVAMENFISEMETEMGIEMVMEGYSYEDIATESIGSKIKGAFAKIKKGNKSEGERDIEEVVSDLQEEESSIETPEEKKKLSNKKKVAIAAGIAALASGGVILAKSKNKKDKQKAELVKKQAEKLKPLLYKDDVSVKDVNTALKSANVVLSKMTGPGSAADQAGKTLLGETSKNISGYKLKRPL